MHDIKIEPMFNSKISLNKFLADLEAKYVGKPKTPDTRAEVQRDIEHFLTGYVCRDPQELKEDLMELFDRHLTLR